jgi:hypothetical protein
MANIIQHLSDIAAVKSALKIAIEDKGQDLTDIPFTGYADKVADISGGGGSGGAITLVAAPGVSGEIGKLVGQDSISLKGYLFRDRQNYTSEGEVAVSATIEKILYDVGGDRWIVTSGQNIYIAEYNVEDDAFSLTELLTGFDNNVSSVALIDYHLTLITAPYTAGIIDTVLLYPLTIGSSIIVGTPQPISLVSEFRTGETRYTTFNGKLYMFVGQYSYSCIILRLSCISSTYSAELSASTSIAPAYIFGFTITGADDETFSAAFHGLYHQSTWNRYFGYQWSSAGTWSSTFDFIGGSRGDYNIETSYAGRTRIPGTSHFLARNSSSGETTLLVRGGYDYTPTALESSVVALFSGAYNVSKIDGETNKYYSLVNTTHQSTTGYFIVLWHLTSSPLGIAVDEVIETDFTSDYSGQLAGAFGDNITFYSFANQIYSIRTVTWRENMLGFISQITPDRFSFVATAGMYSLGITNEVLSTFSSDSLNGGFITSITTGRCYEIEDFTVDENQQIIIPLPFEGILESDTYILSPPAGFDGDLELGPDTWTVDTNTVITELPTSAGYDYYASFDGGLTAIANQYYVGHCTEDGNLVFKDARWGVTEEV